MNDRRVSAVFGPLLIGSIGASKAKEVACIVARLVATAILNRANAVSIERMHRREGRDTLVVSESSKDSFFQMDEREGERRRDQRGAVKL